jgi:hypothetical protein
MIATFRSLWQQSHDIRRKHRDSGAIAALLVCGPAIAYIGGVAKSPAISDILLREWICTRTLDGAELLSNWPHGMRRIDSIRVRRSDFLEFEKRVPRVGA